MWNEDEDDQSFSRTLEHESSHHWGKLIVIILIILACFYGYELFTGMSTFTNKAYDKNNQSTVAESRIDAHRPINVLLMGTDTGAIGRHQKRGRTDTMMVDTVNLNQQSMLLTSIPRDTPANYQGSLTKINSVYLFSGGNATENYVQNWLGVPINYYAVINMGGLDNIINSIGGVNVNPPISFNYGVAHVKKHHPVTLNGYQALDYCRMRHQDPLGDYGRQIRQRQVLFQVFSQLSRPSIIARHPGLVKALSNNLRTNLSTKDLLQLFAFYRHASRKHISNHLQGSSAMIDGQDFEQISPSEKTAKQQQILNDYNH